MLGWMLRRGENASDTDAADSTHVDQPDTPAPVFAARAFKSALFGTPARPNDEPRRRKDKTAARNTMAKSAERGHGTPPNRPGILLTPGTGTSRRKRVSFGHDVSGPANNSGNESATAKNGVGHGQRPRPVEAPGKLQKESPAKAEARSVANSSDDEWEEEEGEGDDCCTHDITLDLNEPHSQSGRYWKGQFERYHQEAKAEMEKLLKYKQLAKSYAQQKDSEAMQLAERLRDEQQKVIQMEQKIAENASHIVSKHRQGADDDPTELISKLSKQTALAAQYRHRVRELEDELDEFWTQKGETADIRGRRRRQGAASPITQKTLMETQRELRRARAQLKELDSLREQVSFLKARVKAAEAEADRNEKGDGLSLGQNRARDLRAQLEQAKEECRKKDEAMRQLKRDFEAFREESDVHEADTKAVLERAHAKISDLKKEMKSLRGAGSDQHGPRGVFPQAGTGQESRTSVAEAGGPNKQPSAQALEGNKQASTDQDDKSAHGSNNKSGPQSVTLRDKFRDGADVASNSAPSALVERPNLRKPRWQPFVPRSPRNRAYLGEQVSRGIRHGAAACTTVEPRDAAAAPDLPGLAKAVSRIGKPEASSGGGDGDGDVDLLQGRFARLGGPGADADADANNAHGDGADNNNNNSLGGATRGSTSKRSALPPERRAAALARIERRMAEKMRVRRRHGSDKENRRP